MTRLLSLPLLRLALLGDAAASGATGLLLALGAGPLTGLLGLPEPLMRGAGLILLPYAAAVALLGTRDNPAPGLVWAVVAVNVLWTLDSLLLLASGRVTPTVLGTAFVLVQAGVVAAFAGVQVVGLRRWVPGASLPA